MSEQSFIKAFTNAMGTLAILLDYDMTQAKIDAYLKYFSGKDFAPEEILRAIEKAADACKFFPKPAELLEIISGGKGGGQDPSVAWDMVLKNVGHHGGGLDVEFQDGAIAAAIVGMDGGWIALCAMTHEERTLQRVPARFQALYAEAVRCGKHLRPGMVRGYHSCNNGSRGLENINEAAKALTKDDVFGLAQPKQLDAPDSKAALPAPEMTPEARVTLSNAMGRLAAKVGLDQAKKLTIPGDGKSTGAVPRPARNDERPQTHTQTRPQNKKAF